MKKRFLASLLALGLLLSMMTGAALAAEGDGEGDSSVPVDSGTFGENLAWHFDGSTLILTIEKSENEPPDEDEAYHIPDYDQASSLPWSAFLEYIQAVAISEGISRIGNGAFAGCTRLTTIAVPDEVTTVGHLAFNGCAALRIITLPASLTTIYADSFQGCTGLTQIIYRGRQNEWEKLLTDNKLTSDDLSLPVGANMVFADDNPPVSATDLTVNTEALDPAEEGRVKVSVVLPDSTTEPPIGVLYYKVFEPSVEPTRPTVGEEIPEGYASLANNSPIEAADGSTVAVIEADADNKIARWGVSVPTNDNFTPPKPEEPEPEQPPELPLTKASGSLGQKITATIAGGNWLTIRVEKNGAIALSSIQAPGSEQTQTPVTFSAPTGSTVTVWETAEEITFDENGLVNVEILAKGAASL